MAVSGHVPMDNGRGSEIPPQYLVQNPHQSASFYVPHFYNAQQAYPNSHYYNPAEPSPFSSTWITYQPGVDSFCAPNAGVGVDGADIYACAAPTQPTQPLNETEPKGTNSKATHGGTSMWHPSASRYTNIKKLPKKTKIVQSAWCEICKIDCNSKEVLEQHKTGKKHRKNFEKLQQASTSSNFSVSKNPNAKNDSQATIRKEAPPSEPTDNLETKKRKLMQGGAAPEAVRVCEVCNVACNSETVYKYHLEGQKHATQLKRRAAAGPAVVGT